MFVDIGQVPVEGLEVQFCESEDFLDPSGVKVHLLRPVEATLHFRRTQTGVWVRGQVSSDFQLHCGRCFDLFTLPVCEDFEVEYRGSLGRGVEEERELDREELDVNFLDGTTINLATLVRENVLLALPVQPLCDEGCQGLCPRCGMNLNRGSCHCSAARRDPRWRKLESLF